MAIISLSMLGCAAQQQSRPVNPVFASKTTKISPIYTTKAGDQKLEGFWRKGSCSFHDNELSYNAFGKSKTLELDVVVEDPREIMCFSQHTVIITPKTIVVSLGGESVMAGDQMLGELSGKFVPANSYALPIEEIAAEGITGKFLKGSEFSLTTNAGNRWTVDLTDPVKWSIY